MDTFAAQIFIGHACSTNMAQRKAGQTVRLVDLQHITLQHGVVRIASHFDTLIGKHMSVVFDVLTHFEFEGVFKPRLELGKHFRHGQLDGRIGAVMPQRQVSRLAWLNTPTDAHQFGSHGIQRGGLSVNGRARCRFKFWQPCIKLLPRQNSFVVLIACDRDHRFWLCKQIVHGHETWFCMGLPSAGGF